MELHQRFLLDDVEPPGEDHRMERWTPCDGRKDRRAPDMDQGRIRPHAGEADQWMAWQRSDISSAFFDIFLGKIRTPTDKIDHEKLIKAATRCGKILALLDRHLATQPFVAGADLTMGDIPIGAMMYRYMELDIERAPLQHLTQWYERLADREAYRKHVMIPFGKNLAEWESLETASTGVQ